jgi:hypothetical protein
VAFEDFAGGPGGEVSGLLREGGTGQCGQSLRGQRGVERADQAGRFLGAGLGFHGCERDVAGDGGGDGDHRAISDPGTADHEAVHRSGFGVDHVRALVRHGRRPRRIGSRSDAVMRKHNALAHRLLDRQDDYLRFTTDWRIPPDNNGSERDIRMIKLRQKVSGCLRTLTGARQFCAIRSYLSTAAKHGRHFFDTLVMLAEGHPWLPT